MSLALGKLLVLILQVIIAVIPWRRIAAWMGLPVHDYRYRNPYDRTCRNCRRTENEYCWDMSEFYSRNAWWEVMHPGYRGHRCSEKDAYENKRTMPDDFRAADNPKDGAQEA